MDKKKIVHAMAFYSVANIFGAFFNMLYQFILVFFLTVEDYGIVVPLFQLLYIFFLPIFSYQFALTKHFSSNNLNLASESRYLVRLLLLISAVFSLIWILVMPFFGSLLHLKEPIVLVPILLALLLYFPFIPYISRLQSEGKFLVAGIAQILQGFSRFLLGIFCVMLFPNVWGALLGILIGHLVFLGVNLSPYFPELFCSKAEISDQITPLPCQSFCIALGSVCFFSLLLYSDTILVRIFLEQDSPLFALSSIFGKGMVFLTTGVSFVILPVMARFTANPKQVVWLGFFILLGLLLTYSLFFFIVAPFIANFLVKNNEVLLYSFSKFMPFYNFMILPHAMVYYFINYYLVKNSIFYLVLLGIFAGLFFSISFLFHTSIYMISLTLGGIGYFLLLIVILHMIFYKEKSQEKGEGNLLRN